MAAYDDAIEFFNRALALRPNEVKVRNVVYD